MGLVLTVSACVAVEYWLDKTYGPSLLLPLCNASRAEPRECTVAAALQSKFISFSQEAQTDQLGKYNCVLAGRKE